MSKEFQPKQREELTEEQLTRYGELAIKLRFLHFEANEAKIEMMSIVKKEAL